VSFFLGGIGDARHLLRTMIGISEFEKPSKVRKRCHFTIVDINKCAIVRDLVVFAARQVRPPGVAQSREPLKIINGHISHNTMQFKKFKLAENIIASRSIILSTFYVS
jgi:hypothetical protein